jgi:Patatin-like phospholipase
VAFGGLHRFDEVFRREIPSINERRALLNRPRIALEQESLDAHDREVLRPTEESAVVGLSLSGGGIRSAAFSLGVLQALDRARVLSKVDYLSTVSGGGYIGSSLSAGTRENGIFPFESSLTTDETPSVQHVRDYSNYLFPTGPADLLHGAAIYVRGLIANIVLIAPWLLLAAASTILMNPDVEALRTPNFLGFAILNAFNFSHFVVTAYISMVLLVCGVLWAVVRSFKSLERSTEVPSILTSAFGWLVILAVFSAFCELQPFLLSAMFEPRGFLGWLAPFIQKVAASLAPFAAIVGFLGRKLGEIIKSASESSTKRGQFAGYTAKAAIYLAAAVVPLLLWAIYLELTYWGIKDRAGHYHAPGWLQHASSLVSGTHVGYFYASVAVVLMLISLLLRPNANSLHALYRDRISKAFLFKPKPKFSDNEELEHDAVKLSELSAKYSPYHLINAALNIQASKTANRRGRNADFFLFSRNFIGSQATGYVETADLEKLVPELDLATVTAVSGAAASSSMGSETIRPLTPTLAMLNIRLGYWLRNPNRVASAKIAWNPFANYYFPAELLGRLDERWKSIYLTDGGHVENLGIYQLLKRRCKVIVAVDAEADPQMGFGSLMVLQRYARIDLGVRIELPWQQIRDVTLETGQKIDETGKCPALSGPHCAIGEIEYPGNRKGILIYIKSSLTGDENDYILYYKQRYASFPHETTLDQLFSEEQFEAYRALGFHAAYDLFDKRAHFAHLDPVARTTELLNALDLLLSPVSEQGRKFGEAI